MASKDVRFVISAKDEATKTFKSIVEALDDVGKEGSEAGGLLSELGREVAALSKEMSALKGADKLAADLEKAGKAVDRLGNETRQSAQEFAKTARETERAAQAAQKHRREVEALSSSLSREKESLKKTSADRRAANAELTKAENAYKRVQAAAEKAAKASPLGLKARTAASAQVLMGGELDKSRATVDRLTSAMEEQKQVVEQTSASLKQKSAALRTAEQNESRLVAQTKRLSEATAQNKKNTDSGRAALDQLKATAASAGQALGGVALRQDEIAKATARAAEAQKQAAAEQAAASRFTNAKGGFTDPKTTAAINAQQQVVNRAKADYEILANVAQRLANNMKMVGPPTADAAQKMQQAAGAAAAAKREFEAQLRVLNQMPGAMSRMNGMRGIFGGIYGESRKAMSVFQRLRGEILSLATAYVGLYGTISNIGGVITAYQSLEAAQNRLGAVFGQDEAKVGRELGFIEAQAARLGIQFGLLADQYGKFSVAANAANFTTSETRKVFLSVAEAGRVNKLSMEQMSGIFLALEQMISKGKVQSEELRRQLGDRLPGAFNIMADALGVTTAELDKMMQQGEVLANSDTMLKFAAELDKRFGSQLAKSLTSTTTLLGQFTNELLQAQLRVAEGGFIDGLNKGLAEMNKWFQSREGRDFFLSIGAALGNLVTALAEVPKYFGVISSAIKLFISYKLTVMVMDMAAAFKTHLKPSLELSAAAFRNAGAASLSFGAGLTTLGTAIKSIGIALRSIPGIAIFAAAAYAIQTLLFDWSSGVEDTTRAVDEHRRLMSELGKHYDEVIKKAGDWSKVVGQISSTQIRANLITLQDEIKKETDKVGAIISEAMEAPGWFSTGGVARRLQGAAKGEVESLERLAEGLKRGAVDLGVFRQAVDEIGKRTGSKIVLDLARQFLEAADKLKEMQESAEKNEAALRVMTGTATEADEALLGLSSATEESAKALSAAQSAAQGYTEALNKLKSGIPELAAEMKQLAEIAEINAIFEQGVADLDAMGGRRSGEKYRALVEMRDMRLNAAMLKDVSASVAASAALLMKKEGFRETPYFDVNALRVGYGSDTITLSDGTIKKVVEGMKVSREDATRDLTRRIGEFQEGIIRKIGGSEFGRFSAEQQAALTSIAYNYGSLPDRVAKVINAGGTTKEIADAIRSLGGDNNGVNRSRRNDEAAIFEGGASADSLFREDEKRLKAEQSIKEELAKQSQAVQDIITSKQFEFQQNEMIAQGLGRQAAIEAAIVEARRQKADLTPEEIAAISEITGKLWDQKNATDGIKEAEAEITRLQSLRGELMQQIEYHQGQGEHAQAEALKQRLEEINTQLQAAVANTIAMYQAMGGPEAELAIARLQNVANSVQEVGTKAVISGEQIASKLAGVLTNAFKAMAQAIANGEDAWEAFSTAFLQGIAEMLIEIGEMIIKQMILNALQGFMGGFGGLGGKVGLFHDGGVVGAAGGQTRQASPMWFRNAARYHDGGIAGLQPGEVPAILEMGEEVLTRDDPRHRANGGGAGGGSTNVKIVNTFDAADVVSEGLSSPAGEQTIINMVKRNSTKINQALGR